jgi:hypothetical protein
MAIHCVHGPSTKEVKHHGEHCALRPGDVVFHWNPGAKFPLHTGIYTGEATISGAASLPILSLPDPNKTPWSLGESDWRQTGNHWHLDMIGQRLDVADTRVAAAANFALQHRTEISQLREVCIWKEVIAYHPTATLRGKPLFIRGSCSQHAWWVYRCVGLELSKYDPSTGARLWPAILIHTFWKGEYEFDPDFQTDKKGKLNPADANLTKYPDCLFGPRATTK